LWPLSRWARHHEVRFGGSLLDRSALFFFFSDTATTVIYTLSLHDALPIFYFAGDNAWLAQHGVVIGVVMLYLSRQLAQGDRQARSEEHTSELQSPCNLVCRLLLEKKKL